MYSAGLSNERPPVPGDNPPDRTVLDRFLIGTVETDNRAVVVTADGVYIAPDINVINKALQLPSSNRWRSFNDRMKQNGSAFPLLSIGIIANACFLSDSVHDVPPIVTAADESLVGYGVARVIFATAASIEKRRALRNSTMLNINAANNELLFYPNEAVAISAYDTAQVNDKADPLRFWIRYGNEINLGDFVADLLRHHPEPAFLKQMVPVLDNVISRNRQLEELAQQIFTLEEEEVTTGEEIDAIRTSVQEIRENNRLALMSLSAAANDQK